MKPFLIHLYEDEDLAKVVRDFTVPANRDLLPRSLKLYPRGFPNVGTDVEFVYRRPLTDSRSHRNTLSGVLAWETGTGWLAHMHPRGLVEDDPYQSLLDLLRIYQVFCGSLDSSDPRRSEMRLIGRYVETYWLRQEFMLRPKLLFPPVT